MAIFPNSMLTSASARAAGACGIALGRAHRNECAPAGGAGSGGGGRGGGGGADGGGEATAVATAATGRGACSSATGVGEGRGASGGAADEPTADGSLLEGRSRRHLPHTTGRETGRESEARLLGSETLSAAGSSDWLASRADAAPSSAAVGEGEGDEWGEADGEADGEAEAVGDVGAVSVHGPPALPPNSSSVTSASSSSSPVGSGSGSGGSCATDCAGAGGGDGWEEEATGRRRVGGDG